MCESTSASLKRQFSGVTIGDLSVRNILHSLTRPYQAARGSSQDQVGGVWVAIGGPSVGMSRGQINYDPWDRDHRGLIISKEMNIGFQEERSNNKYGSSGSEGRRMNAEEGRWENGGAEWEGPG